MTTEALQLVLYLACIEDALRYNLRGAESDVERWSRLWRTNMTAWARLRGRDYQNGATPG